MASRCVGRWSVCQVSVCVGTGVVLIRVSVAVAVFMVKVRVMVVIVVRQWNEFLEDFMMMMVVVMAFADDRGIGQGTALET